MNSPQALKLRRARADYDAVDDFHKSNLVEACQWAREKLTAHEGEGHIIDVSGHRDGTVSCSFAKPEWRGDHSGSRMDSASEAVIIAVCEYLRGC